MKKKSLALLLVLAMIFTFALSACGGSSSDETAADTSEDTVESTSDVAAAYNNILEGLEAEAGETDGTITVATSPDFAPMEFVDLSRSGDEQYVGYDILLAKYIANKLGKELVIKPMSFDAVMTAVATGNVDLGISGFSWTAERAKNYYISDWYEAGDNETEQTVITTKENADKFNSTADFSGLKVGAQGGSLQELLVEEQLVPEGAECVLMQDLNDLCTALLTGKIDALAVAVGNGESFVSANPDALTETSFLFEIDEKYKNNVVLINKDNEELGKQIDEIIAQQKADGVADAWYEACQLLGEIKTIDELGYDDEGNKITE